jgi:hypothetical protein
MDGVERQRSSIALGLPMYRVDAAIRRRFENVHILLPAGARTHMFKMNTGDTPTAFDRVIPLITQAWLW